MNTQRIELDISKPDAFTQMVTIGQGDKAGTTIVATIYDNGTLADLDGMDARFECRLPDGHSYVRDVNCTVSGSEITYVVDEEHVASVAGATDEAYFVILDGTEEVYSTNRFRLKVLRSAHDGAVPAEDWDNAVDELIERGNAALEEYSEAEEGRAEAESGRVAAETARAAAESQRDTSESAREASEGARASAESTRRSDETSRKSYETQRRSAETARADAETARQTAEARRVADFAIMEQRSKGWLRYYCAAGEYDPTTRKPTIADPDESTLYYVPAEHPTTDNQWVEWQYDTSGNRWEMQGTTEVTVSPVTTAQIDAIANDETVTSSNVLQATGLTYLWAKLKAAFASLVHVHSASDITSGTLGVSGASTAAAARTNLGVTAANVVNGNAITPASVAATGAVSGSSVSDSVGSLADVRDSVYLNLSTILTFNSGFSLRGGNVYRKNGVIYFDIGVNCATNQADGVEFQPFTVKSGYRPYAAGFGGGLNNYTRIQIDGIVIVRSVGGGTVFWIAGSYLVQ